MHRIGLWAIGPILLVCAATGGTTNPDDSVTMLALGGVITSLVFTLPAGIHLYRSLSANYCHWCGKRLEPGTRRNYHQECAEYVELMSGQNLS
jgi:hypothetical protein